MASAWRIGWAASRAKPRSTPPPRRDFDAAMKTVGPSKMRALRRCARHNSTSGGQVSERESDSRPTRWRSQIELMIVNQARGHRRSAGRSPVGPARSPSRAILRGSHMEMGDTIPNSTGPPALEVTIVGEAITHSRNAEGARPVGAEDGGVARPRIHGVDVVVDSSPAVPSMMFAPRWRERSVRTPRYASSKTAGGGPIIRGSGSSSRCSAATLAQRSAPLARAAVTTHRSCVGVHRPSAHRGLRWHGGPSRAAMSRTALGCLCRRSSCALHPKLGVLIRSHPRSRRSTAAATSPPRT